MSFRKPAITLAKTTAIPRPLLHRRKLSAHTTLVNSGHSLKSLVSVKLYFQPGGKNLRSCSRCWFYCKAYTRCVSIPRLPKIIPLSTATEPLQIRLGLGLGSEQMILWNWNSSRCWNGAREEIHTVSLCSVLSVFLTLSWCSASMRCQRYVASVTRAWAWISPPSLGFFFQLFT